MTVMRAPSSSARALVRGAWWVAIAVGSGGGCREPVVPPEAGSSGDASGTSVDATGTTGGIGATSLGDGTTLEGTDGLDTSTGSSESGPPPPGCGNGIVEPGERCDDPLADPPTCSADCQYPRLSCEGSSFDCGNTLDDDGDGLVDMDDPDCLSPCDEHEHELAMGGIDGGPPGELDCYWDVSTGQGDDGCVHDLTCDPESPGAPSYPYQPSPDCMSPPSPECIAACVPLVPNGCDCFGCCVIDGQTIFLGLDEGFGSPDPDFPCAAASLENCNGCTIEGSCFNFCDPAACELCFLQGPERLAAGCDTPACSDGVLSCASSYECPEATVCKAGCCLGYAVPPPA
jgi:hypothetical protein